MTSKLPIETAEQRLGIYKQALKFYQDGVAITFPDGRYRHPVSDCHNTSAGYGLCLSLCSLCDGNWYYYDTCDYFPEFGAYMNKYPRPSDTDQPKLAQWRLDALKYCINECSPVNIDFSKLPSGTWLVRDWGTRGECIDFALFTSQSSYEREFFFDKFIRFYADGRTWIPEVMETAAIIDKPIWKIASDSQLLEHNLTNDTPKVVKMESLEKRMYFLTMYNISPIQQGIQCGHAALEYAHEYKDDPEFIDFVENWKTWIILNGGTSTSEDSGSVGSMEQHLNTIRQLGINYSTFNEPDLNFSLTSICFILDERVFDKKKYPYYKDWAGKRFDADISCDGSDHPQYVTLMGGTTNIKLRAFIDQFRLA